MIYIWTIFAVKKKMVAYKYTKSTFIGSDNELLHVTKLDCSKCAITSFEGLNAPNLTTLDCSYNHLTSFQHLNFATLIALTELYCSGNEWEFIPPHINRLLNTTRNTQNVYGDGQNVHNHHIQESIRSSIQAVLSKKPCIAAENLYETVLSDTVLTTLTRVDCIHWIIVKTLNK